MSKAKAYKIIESIIFIILGILIAVSILNASILNYLLGGCVTLLGIFLFIKCATEQKNVNFLLPTGVASAVLLACGISMLANYINAVDLLQKVIIVGVLAIGILLIIDAIVRFIRKQSTPGITELVVGLILTILAILFMVIPEMNSYLWVVFGVLLAIYGVYLLVQTLITLKK